MSDGSGRTEKPKANSASESGAEKPGIFFPDDSGRPGLPEQTNYQVAEQMAWEALGRVNPGSQAQRCKAQLIGPSSDDWVFRLDYFGTPVEVTFASREVTDPNGECSIPVWERILILHYLGSDSPVPARSDYLGFKQVPYGGFYFHAFKRRAHDPLARTFGQNPKLLVRAGRSLGGEPENLGDAAVRIQMLPEVSVVAVVYAADHEFPADAKILFESSIAAYFCTEDIAVIGGLVAGRLIRAARKLSDGEKA